jgi:hypothetical protein
MQHFFKPHTFSGQQPSSASASSWASALTLSFTLVYTFQNHYLQSNSHNERESVKNPKSETQKVNAMRLF